MNSPPEVLRSMATGYLQTDIVRDERGLLVRRRPGVAREDTLSVDPHVRRLLTSAPAEATWVHPRTGGDGSEVLEFEVPGELSVAALVLAGLPTDAAGAMLAPLGAGLAQVHRHDAGDRPEPSGLRRLRRWLRAGTGPGAVDRLHELVIRMDLQEPLDALVQQLQATGPEGVLSLGAPGMNTVFPRRGGRQVALLVTDEVSAARPEWDLGWCVGELLELENDVELVPEPRSLGDHPTVAPFLHAYRETGGRADPESVSAAAVLRWAVHLHDFTAFVGWADDVEQRLRRLAHFAARPQAVLT